MVIYPEEIRVKLMLPHRSNKKIEETLKENIRRTRKENGIHLWITRIENEGGVIYADMEGERIKKIPTFRSRTLPRRYPKKFSVFVTINDPKDLMEALERKKKQIKRKCGESYSAKMIGYNIERGKEILIVLLAEMIS